MTDEGDVLDRLVKRDDPLCQEAANEIILLRNRVGAVERACIELGKQIFNWSEEDEEVPAD